MVRKFFFFFILVGGLFGNNLEDCIENFIGKQAYYTNQNFIKKLFKDEKKFINEGQIDYFLILKTLKDNGLLELMFSEPSELQITIKAKSKPIFLTRIINSTLSSIGYSYFTISKAKYEQGEVELTFSLVTEHILDPVIFLNELRKRGMISLSVKRDNLLHWEYNLEIQKWITLGSTPLLKQARFDIKKISGEYWFDVQAPGVLYIKKKNTRIGWFPRIVLYDKNLQILEIITQNSFAVESEIALNEKTAFVMVTDLNNPARLKYGLSVVFTPY
ncbi:hypothetical protein [Helicobacter cholecystus]|uniref:hypothetical protein n=1 Tax=Helicobacter cholecystus TaxID=45498 RepID=UPI002739E7FF|nr:hypothetical protein [Helicobacter cholecystus]